MSKNESQQLILSEKLTTWMNLTTQMKLSTLPQILSSSLISELWTKMAEIYGHRWITNFGKSDSGTWLEGLRGLTPELVRNGLRKCIHRIDPWPPTLPDFRSMCFGNVDREQAVQQAIRGCDSAIAHKMRSLVTSHDWSHRTYPELLVMLRGVYPLATSETTVSILTLQYQKMMEAPVD